MLITVAVEIVVILMYDVNRFMTIFIRMRHETLSEIRPTN